MYQQTVFGNGGEMELEEGSIGTSLEDFEANGNHRERETRIDQPAASEFGIDDRPVVRRVSDEQSGLFTRADEDQCTFEGAQAADQSLF